jgi:glycosyltransferase involved in cell wall biosynthesis
MANSAAAAGYDVVIYARWSDGLPFEDRLAGHRVVRVPVELTMAIPGLRRLGRMRIRHLRAREGQRGQAAIDELTRGGDAAATGAAGVDAPPRFRAHSLLRWGNRIFLRALRMLPKWTRAPMMWIAWRRALLDVVEPADIWHGMWMASLPAIVTLSRSFGGEAVYDSRDVFFESRDWPKVGLLPRAWLMALERRWARACADVLTVSEPYAEILARKLRVAKPVVVMNCPERFDPDRARTNLIRERLGLSQTKAIVLYQGGLLTERGIEQTMDAIVAIPDACFVVMGYGNQREKLEEAVCRDPYVDRVFLLEPVAPAQLLQWTASADVMIALYPPLSLNHRYVTPQKLFEAMAAGVPVVATDGPAMAEIVRATGCGVLCQSMAPKAIAAAIQSILELPAEERRALRARCLAAAHGRYNWESQVGTLLDLYGRLAPAPAVGAASGGRGA